MKIIMTESRFEERLKGGHPNSLGKTEEIAGEVLADESKLPELFKTWKSEDELVRLRVASAIKRVCIAEPDWMVGYVDELQSEIATIDQASTQWILAKLFQILESRLTEAQRRRALELMKHNLESHDDWIVLNNTMETLRDWSVFDPELKTWLVPRLKALTKETRKSVAKRASKYLREFD